MEGIETESESSGSDSSSSSSGSSGSSSSREVDYSRSNSAEKVNSVVNMNGCPGVVKEEQEEESKSITQTPTEPAVSSASNSRASTIKQQKGTAHPKLAPIQENETGEVDPSIQSKEGSEELDEREMLIQEQTRLNEDLRRQNAYLKNNLEFFKDYISN